MELVIVLGLVIAFLLVLCLSKHVVKDSRLAFWMGLRASFAADGVTKTGEALRELSEWIATLNALQRRRPTDRTWADVVQLFETRLGGVRLSARLQSGTLVPRLPVACLLDALYLELWGVATRGKRLRQCKRCARFFIRGRADQIFCTGPCARLWHVRKWKRAHRRTRKARR